MRSFLAPDRTLAGSADRQSKEDLYIHYTFWYICSYHDEVWIIKCLGYVLWFCLVKLWGSVARVLRRPSWVLWSTSHLSFLVYYCSFCKNTHTIVLAPLTDLLEGNVHLLWSSLCGHCSMSMVMSTQLKPCFKSKPNEFSSFCQLP